MEDNPYATPRALVADQPVGSSAIEEFPRFSTWWALLLSIVTLSIYMPYWMYSRTRVLHRVAPGKPVPAAVIVISLLLFVVNIGFGVLEGVYPNDVTIRLYSQLLSIASGISFVVWVLMFRSRLNTLLGVTRESPLWLSGPMAFFFQILYLQYKINHAIDSRSAD
jgi:hypothetical protein